MVVNDAYYLVGGDERNMTCIFPFSWECDHPNWFSYFSEGFKPPTRCWFILKLIHVGLQICLETLNWRNLDCSWFRRSFSHCFSMILSMMLGDCEGWTKIPWWLHSIQYTRYIIIYLYNGHMFSLFLIILSTSPTFAQTPHTIELNYETCSMYVEQHCMTGLTLIIRNIFQTQSLKVQGALLRFFL